MAKRIIVSASTPNASNGTLNGKAIEMSRVEVHGLGDTLSTLGDKTIRELNFTVLYVDLNGGAILKVTSAHWYTPNDNGINGTGIEPDEKVERTYEQINKNEDPQLDKAFSLIK